LNIRSQLVLFRVRIVRFAEWADHCTDVWNADSLFDVANISRGQVKKLEVAEVTTLEALASHDGHVKGIAPATEGRLKMQARPSATRKISKPLNFGPMKPAKALIFFASARKGDLFYDMRVIRITRASSISSTVSGSMGSSKASGRMIVRSRRNR